MLSNCSLPETSVSKAVVLSEFWNYRNRFLGRIRRFTADRDSAEDIFQDACVKFLRTDASFSCPEKATSYFCRIIRSLIADERSRRRRIQYLDDMPELAYVINEDCDRGMLIVRVFRAVRRLPARDRELLRVWLDPEVARIKDKCSLLNFTCGNLRYRVNKIFSRLRRLTEQIPKY
jgi:RNA polymerase sigma factor (sigma-70 family)